jgi:hypothetical protein
MSLGKDFVSRNVDFRMPCARLMFKQVTTLNSADEQKGQIQWEKQAAREGL